MRKVMGACPGAWLVHATFCDPFKAERRTLLNSYILAFLPLRLWRVLGTNSASPSGPSQPPAEAWLAAAW